MIKNGGTPPEKLAIAEDISGVKKRLKSAHRAMKKMDGKPKSGQKLLGRPTSPA
jgi:hypothetical protein